MTREFSPAVREVRKTRLAISAKFGHDVRKLGEYYIELQQDPEYRKRLTTAPLKRKKKSV